MRELIRELTHPSPMAFERVGNARVLQFSMRRVADLVASCGLYEFEDLVREMVPADRAEPEHLESQNFLRKVYKVARSAVGSARLAARLTPRRTSLRIERDYDLFLPVFNDAFEVFALDAIDGWREHSRWAACFITEVWSRNIPGYLVERLSRFDRIYLGVTGPVDEIARMTGRPCSYLPLGVDAFLFARDPRAPRTIDVCGVGRRSAVTHEALLAMAKKRSLFYYFDTVRTRGIPDAARQITFSVQKPSEHRFLYASLLKNSRYMLASRARANEPDTTGASQEIAARFFEGAAGGAVMIGAPPRNAIFDSYFDWPDAVIAMPFDNPKVADVIDRLDAEPERVARIRGNNVVNSLLKSDWVYRLQSIFDDAGLEPTGAMAERIAALRALAGQVGAAHGFAA